MQFRLRWSGWVAAAIIGAASLMPVPPASAQPNIRPPSAPPSQQPSQPQGGAGNLIQGVTPEITAEVLKAAGYSNVEVYTAKSGSKHASGTAHGNTVSVIHMHCKDGLCPAVVFMVNFGKQDTIDFAYTNGWHTDKLYTRLYQNNGDLFFTWPAFLGDASLSHLQRVASLYAVLLKDLMSYKPGQQQ